MRSKLQAITELLIFSTKQSTATVEDWKSFLTSSAWHYKYPYTDRLLIHAQRPDATACAEFEVWNERLDRRISRGSKGIALLTTVGSKTQLRYVFDVSDTYSRKNVPFKLWEAKPEYAPAICEALSDSYDFSFNDSIEAAVFGAAANAVSDNTADYLQRLEARAGGSMLEGITGDDLKMHLFNALTVAVSHTVLTRLGFDPSEYIQDSDYEAVLMFNTHSTANVLGTAAGDISEMILRTIERTVRAEEKKRDIVARRDLPRDNVRENNNTTERRPDNGDNLYSEGRLPVSRPVSAVPADGGHREVRQDAQEVPQGASEGHLRPASHGEPPAGAPDRNQQASSGDDRHDHGADRESDGRDRGTQSLGSARMDPQDERAESGSGTAGDQGNSPQLNLFGEETGTPPVFSISQEDFDAELVRGSGFSEGKYRIYRFYQVNPSKDDAVAFLKREYGIGGHSHTYLEGTHGFVDHDGKGLSFAVYSGKERTEYLFKWPQVDSRLRFLITADRYFSQKEKDGLPAYEERERERREQLEEERRNRDEMRAAAQRMEEKRAEAKYKLTLGETVYIGSQEYSISSFDDNTVLLYNPRCPLISEEMPRSEFDAKLRENPLNDGLIDDGEPVIEEAPSISKAPLSDTVHVGDTIEHDGRSYVVESIGSKSRDVSMRDITFGRENGFPINRVEKLETVEGWLEEAETDLKPAWEKTKPEDMPITPSPTGEKHDFRITDMELGYGGPKAKFRMNTDAIRLLKQLEGENRLATPDEQTVLSKYVGWGALSMAFDEGKPEWETEYAELKELLTPEEYAAARASTLNAHYTI